MAQHVAQVMSDHDADRHAPEFAERLALLPPALGGGQERRFISFASKFAHFFVNAESFPIFDSYAAAMVDFHLRGSSCTKTESLGCYVDFSRGTARLRNEAGLTCTTRESDHYLWLAGLYRHFLAGHTKINGEVRQLIENPAQSAPDLKELLP